jgi:hypothetical protein
MKFKGKYFLTHIDRFFLQKIFGFNKWHIQKLSDRPYAKAIVDYLNSDKKINKDSIIEIGAGLGDIIFNVNFKKKYLFDNEIDVLKCARILNSFKIISQQDIHFQLFNFPDDIQLQTDCIIMVNWIHMIEGCVLEKYLEHYFNYNLNINGLLILDSANSKHHENQHDIENIAIMLNATVKKLGPYEYSRYIYILKKEL